MVTDSTLVIYVKKKNPQAHEINLESYTDYRSNDEHSYSDKIHFSTAELPFPWNPLKEWHHLSLM